MKNIFSITTKATQIYFTKLFLDGLMKRWKSKPPFTSGEKDWRRNASISKYQNIYSRLSPSQHVSYSISKWFVSFSSNHLDSLLRSAPSHNGASIFSISRNYWWKKSLEKNIEIVKFFLLTCTHMKIHFHIWKLLENARKRAEEEKKNPINCFHGRSGKIVARKVAGGFWGWVGGE